MIGTMNIAFVCFEAFNPGGIRVYTRELLNRLAAGGHRVVLFAPPPGPGLLEGLDQGVELRILPVPGAPFTSAPAFGIQLPLELHKAERTDGQFDIVHSNTFGDSLLPKYWMRAVRITTVHHLGSSAAESMGLSFLHRVSHPSSEYGPAVALEGFSLRRADHLIGVSEFTRNDVLRRYPFIKPDQISVVYHGSKPRSLGAHFAEAERLRNRWGIDSEDRVLLYVGRLEERKGIPLLLQITAHLNRRIGVKLLLVGAGTPTPYIRLAQNMGIADHVAFASFVDEKTLDGAYAIADVLLHPAALEGFGIAIADAVASGVPVVAFRVGSVPEIVRDEAEGRLVAYGDSQGFLSAVVEILEKRPRARDRGPTPGPPRLTWERTVSETLAVYKRVIEQREVTSARRQRA